MGSASLSYEERFYSKVHKTPTCWLWTGANNGANGYGVFSVGRRVIKAHRFAYLAFKGPIIGDLNVLHRCDNRRCVNPDHLFLGTQSDNIRDMFAKGRGDKPHARGEAHGGARLTAEQVKHIKASPHVPRRTLAEQYGVTVFTIAAIRSGRLWAHV